jgi:TRAP transporter 4TM/12TM fusion protein
MATFTSLLVTLTSTGPTRQLEGWLGKLIRVYAAGIAVWTVYAAVFAVIDPWVMSVIFLCSIYGLVFVSIAPSPASDPRRVSPVDWALSLASIATGVHMVIHAPELVTRIQFLDDLSTAHVVFGSILFVTTIEATRRATGLGLTLLVLLLVVYNLFGDRLSGPLSHGVITYTHFLETNVFTSEGILGAAVRVTADYVFLFVLFGTLLAICGGGDFFFNLAAALTGKRVGGPAKIAVISAGMFGTISGSPTADVVTTGSVNIPIMRRLGYSRQFAGGLEAAASTGGSLMPPVMGSAAFIMAEMTGIEYRDIALAALGPALLYYAAILFQVHYQSKKFGFAGLSSVPALWQTLKGGGIFAVPLVTITGFLAAGYSPTLTALAGSISVIAVSLLTPRYRMSVVRLLSALHQTTLRIVPLAGACAAAGLISAGLTMTGMAGKFSQLIIMMSGGTLFGTLVAAAILTIVLGLGMPSAAAYILAAALIGPVLVKLGLDLIVAHMFLLYYALLSSISPPVASAAYAAASIAEANPIRIATIACRLAFVAFIVPFAFAYSPELLLIGDPFFILLAFVTASLGVWLLAIAIEGYYAAPLSAVGRIGLTISGLLLLIPSVLGALIGAAILAITALYEIRLGKRRVAAGASADRRAGAAAFDHLYKSTD